MNIDQGVNFGKWKDKTSVMLYDKCMPIFLSEIKTSGIVGDFGGANGNLKKYIPNSVSIDIDKTKNPDIVDDILTHSNIYDLIVIRYVLHYLSPKQQKELLKNIIKSGNKKILIIQFVNNGRDMQIKKENSINEKKYFLTTQKLFSLFSGFNICNVDKLKINVSKAFYKNRLKNNNAKPHDEEIYSILLEVK